MFLNNSPEWGRLGGEGKERKGKERLTVTFVIVWENNEE